MATYGGGVKVSAAVSATGSDSTIFTGAASGYALVNLALNAVTFGAGPFTAKISIGGQQLLSLTNDGYVYTQAIVGPGQAVVVSDTGNITATGYISGVQLINGP